jgi:oligopeptide/dipeptide ABC transporter ATP-binding protein
MGVVLITHDLGVAARVAQAIVVMYAGRVVEVGSSDALFAAPQHPYTRALLACVPHRQAASGRRLAPIQGAPPALGELPPGCAFAPRCPEMLRRCTVEDPELAPIGPDQRVACWARVPGAREEARV